jgi:hypothetical protein
MEDWEKFTYYHFWVGNKHIRVPKPFEVGALFSSAVEAALDATMGADDLSQIADWFKNTAFNTFAVGLPQLMKPPLEIYANKSTFTGRKIIGMHLERLQPGQQFEPWTSESMRVLGERLNISPKKLEFLVQGYGAAFGTMLLGMSDIMVRQFVDFPTNPTMRIDDYPLAGRFVRERQPARYTQYTSRFYDMFNEVDQLIGTINHYRRLGDFDAARDLATSQVEKLKFRKATVTMRDQLSKINNQTRTIMRDPRLSPEGKRNEIDRLLQMRNDLTEKMYQAYMKAR